MLKKYPQIEKIGEDKFRPGIVHRLDKEASGLMVIAKTQASFDNLKLQFQNKQIFKEYTALVYGQVEKNYDKITFPIKRAEAGYKMAAVPKNFSENNDDNTKDAITEFDIKKRFINFTLLNVRIKTGRTHQIRVHMHSYGHPIVGDPLYHTKKTKELNNKINLDRIFLVATRLSFKDLDGQKQNFKIDIPAELKKVLKEVK